MSGCGSTLAILSGKLARKRQPLPPAGHAPQVIQNLATFWQNVDLQVRKEVWGRYPKNPRPEDPVEAKPTMSTRKQ